MLVSCKICRCKCYLGRPMTMAVFFSLSSQFTCLVFHAHVSQIAKQCVFLKEILQESCFKKYISSFLSFLQLILSNHALIHCIVLRVDRRGSQQKKKYTPYKIYLNGVSVSEKTFIEKITLKYIIGFHMSSFKSCRGKIINFIV